MSKSSILEILRQNQLRRLERSETYSKIVEQNVTAKASHAKCVLGGEDFDSSVPIPVLQLARTYYNLLESYKGEHKALFVEMNKRSVALWTRVEGARKQADCEAERFLKAQFVWFDKTFGRAPALEQLCTEAAVERALEFTGSTKGKVLGNIRKAPITKADTFRESEKLLQKMMIAQKCNREEFYKKFVVTGIYLFPEEFLKADPVYKKVVEG